MQTISTPDASRGSGPHRSKVAGWHRSSKQLPGDLPSLSRTQDGIGIASWTQRYLMKENLDRCIMITVMACSIHCRAGSSENTPWTSRGRAAVHCRVGSSENVKIGDRFYAPVHCRVGSSETCAQPGLCANRVHCRAGSSSNARGIHRTRCWVGGSNPCDAIAKDRSPPSFFSRAKWKTFFWKNPCQS